MWILLNRCGGNNTAIYVTSQPNLRHKTADTFTLQRAMAYEQLRHRTNVNIQTLLLPFKNAFLGKSYVCRELRVDRRACTQVSFRNYCPARNCALQNALLCKKAKSDECHFISHFTFPISNLSSGGISGIKDRHPIWRIDTEWNGLSSTQVDRPMASNRFCDPAASTAFIV